MRMSYGLLAFVVVLALIFVPISADDSDAAVPDPDEVWYSYSYDHTYFYEGGGQPTDVEWEAIGIDRETGAEMTIEQLGSPSSDNAWAIQLDRDQLSECSEVYVTQKVYGASGWDDMTMKVIILADTSESAFAVTFYDGFTSSVVHVKPFHESTKVAYGDTFVDVPAAPEREGYDFVGWFYGSDMNKKFDQYAPVTEDVDVYAKWSPVTSGGTSGSINVGSHIVTFDCSTGLTYTLLDSGNGRVSFTVSELPDYQVIEGSIEVEANGNPVSPVDGVYTVTGINTDVLITIDGDLMFSGNPNDPASDDGGMPMWMWIMLVVVILLIAAAILWMRGRQIDQGRI